MNLAVIPARGGSQRIPRKNIRPFRGKPMIAWSIDTARRSALFEHVLVSTEDAEIAAVAVEHGAECPFVRPAELADHHASTAAVIAHATRWALEAGWAFEAVCCLYATVPFLQVEDVRRGLDALVSGDWAFAVAVTDFAAPPLRSFRQREDGGLEMFFPEHLTTRSQDLPRAFHDAAQFYWGRPSAWLEQRPIFGRSTVPVFIPRWRVQDIDDADDWVRAELMWAHLGRPEA